MIKTVQHFKTIFLSDLHLGTRGCQAEQVLDFLKHHDADTIYLVGDIVDCWNIHKGYWPQAHNDVIQKLLKKARHGSRVIFIPGNHDEYARQFAGLVFGGVEIKLNAIHTTADNRRFLVLHGDEFDVVVRNAKWLAILGDWAYDFAMSVNITISFFRRLFKLHYWSFSAWAKLKVKKAVNFIGDFEKELAKEARRQNLDGIICGHIHHPHKTTVDGVTYINIGDFVESCSMLVEHDDGFLEIRWWGNVKEGVDVNEYVPVRF